MSIDVSPITKQRREETQKSYSYDSKMTTINEDEIKQGGCVSMIFPMYCIIIGSYLPIIKDCVLVYTHTHTHTHKYTHSQQTQNTYTS